jgi:hypothetical protein
MPFNAANDLTSVERSGGQGMHAFGTTNGGDHCSYFRGGDDFGAGPTASLLMMNRHIANNGGFRQ